MILRNKELMAKFSAGTATAATLGTLTFKDASPEGLLTATASTAIMSLLGYTLGHLSTSIHFLNKKIKEVEPIESIEECGLFECELND